MGRAIKESIEPGSTVMSDGWEGYSKVKTSGYIHKVVKKDASMGVELLPSSNMVASLLKRWLLGTHQGRAQHLDYYLDEFTFRFNRRTSKSRGQLFYRLIEQSMIIDPIHSRNLVERFF